MGRLILSTASVITLSAALTFAGAAPASAWGHHAAMHSRAMQSSHAEIRDVQQKLQADNLYNGKIDGLLGPQTRRAIADYQKQNGLRVTANLDRQTKDSLLGTMGAGTPPTTVRRMNPPSNQGGASNQSSPGGGNSATVK